MATWKTEKALANYAQRMNLELKTSPDGSGFTAVLPGLDISMLDKEGFPSPWTVSKEGQILRFIGHRYPNFLMNRLEDYSGDTVSMVVACRQRLYPALYTDSRLKYPMEMSVKVSAVGRAALAVVRSLRHQTSQALLSEDLVIVVNVNKATRKASPFDTAFLERYSKICSKNTVMPKIDSPLKPTGAEQHNNFFHCRRQVVRSDLDHLNHVNQPYYLKFCLDAASLAMRDDDPQSMVASLVKQVDSVHKAEAREGELMDIYMWRATAPDTQHFQIEVQSKVVYNATVQFYPKGACSKL